MDPVVSVQNKNLSGNTKELAKFLEPNRKLKVMDTDSSLEFGKACEDLPWNHCTSTSHRSEINRIGKRAMCRVKEGTLQFCCSQVWMKNGGQIPWNAVPIFETLQIYYLMGKRLVKDVFENRKRTDHSVWFTG